MNLPMVSSVVSFPLLDLGPLPQPSGLALAPGSLPGASETLKPWFHHHEALRSQKCGRWWPEQNPPPPGPGHAEQVAEILQRLIPPFPSHSCFLPFLFSLSSLLEEARLAPALEVLGPLALGEDRHHQG